MQSGQEIRLLGWHHQQLIAEAVQDLDDRTMLSAEGVLTLGDLDNPSIATSGDFAFVVGDEFYVVDSNGELNAATDGILIIRYLFEFRDTVLTSNAVGANAPNNSPAEIEAVLDSSAGMLDADGNGNPDAATDGILIIRYLFEFRDTALVTGAISPGATRTTGQQVADFLDGFTQPGGGNAPSGGSASGVGWGEGSGHSQNSGGGGSGQSEGGGSDQSENGGNNGPGQRGSSDSGDSGRGQNDGDGSGSLESKFGGSVGSAAASSSGLTGFSNGAMATSAVQPSNLPRMSSIDLRQVSRSSFNRFGFLREEGETDLFAHIQDAAEEAPLRTPNENDDSVWIDLEFESTVDWLSLF